MEISYVSDALMTEDSDMNKRSREILSELIKKTELNQTTTMSELEKFYKVSNRTIRNDIKQISEYLTEHRLTPVKLGKQGSILTNEDIRNAGELLMEEGFYSFRLTQEDRIAYAAIVMLICDHYVTLADLADNLFVSRSTVIQDLDKIKKLFKDNNLYLFSHSNKGLLLEGRESDKRLLLLKIIQSDTSIFKDKPVRIHLVQMLSKDKPVNLEEQSTLEKILIEAENAYGRHFTDSSFLHLKDFLEFTIYRLRANQFVEIQKEKNSKWKMAQGILIQICRYFRLQIPKEEVLFLSSMLNRFKYIRKSTSNREIVKMQVITRNFIEKISEGLDVNLDSDYIFYENLINHLESTFSNIEGIWQTNEVVQKVLERYPKVLDVTQKNIFVLEEYTERKISREEIAYIVVHICAALERNRYNNSQYNVIIVCNGGIGTSQLLLARLEKYFRLNVLDILAAHELKNHDLKKADIIISTVPLDKWGVDYVQVDPLLTDQDCIEVGKKLSVLKPEVRRKEKIHDQKKETENSEQILLKIKEILDNSDEDSKVTNMIRHQVDKYFREKSQVRLTELLPKEAIKLDVKCADWKEAICSSAEYLLEQGSIEQSYIQAMIENVRINGPYIVVGKGFALPHEALSTAVKATGLSLIRLKEPVAFGKEELDPVLWVCCLSAIDKNAHLKAMFHIINIFNDPQFRKTADTVNNVEELYYLIEDYEKDMK